MTDEENDTGDNDPDKRPRVYGRATGDEGTVEVTLQGGEGETSDDVMGRLSEAVGEMTDAQAKMRGENEREKGVE